MNKFSEKLDQLETRLRQVGEKMRRMEVVNGQLSEENEQLKAALAERDSKVNALQQQLQMTAEQAGEKAPVRSESSQKIRKEIDQCIKEIDKCMDWLSAT